MWTSSFLIGPKGLRKFSARFSQWVIIDTFCMLIGDIQLNTCALRKTKYPSPFTDTFSIFNRFTFKKYVHIVLFNVIQIAHCSWNNRYNTNCCFSHSLHSQSYNISIVCSHRIITHHIIASFARATPWNCFSNPLFLSLSFRSLLSMAAKTFGGI